MNTIHIYTDGACSGNPGPGGAAAILLKNGKVFHRVGRGFKNTTNNRMEIQAVIYGLKAAAERLEDTTSIVFFTDSSYVKDTITKNYRRLQNKDLWAVLDEKLKDLRDAGVAVTFEKVKGHAEDRWNNEVDALAVRLRQMPESSLLDDTGYNDKKAEETKASASLFAEKKADDDIVSRVSAIILKHYNKTQSEEVRKALMDINQEIAVSIAC